MGWTKNVLVKGRIDVPFNVDYEGNKVSGIIDLKVNARVDIWHMNGRMYLSNGDPGYPEENSIELVTLEDIDFQEFSKLEGLPEDSDEEKFIDWLYEQESFQQAVNTVADECIDEFEKEER